MSTQRFTRREFIVGSTAAFAVAACGGAPTAANPQLVSLFSPDHVIAAGIEQRIPFAVVDIGSFDLAEAAEVEVTVARDDADDDGNPVDVTTVLGRVVDHDHTTSADPDHQHADLLRYFALRTTLPEPGIYDLTVDFGPAGVGRLPVQAFAEDSVPVPLPGQPMPPIATPTNAKPEGADPLCTRAPEPCSFHAESVASILDAGRPLALLVATPALCATAYCGPVLETLISVAPEFESIAFAHLEVYANAADANGNYDDPDIELVTAVTELGLRFEPSLFAVDSSGTIVDRIDNIFDRSELVETLERLR